MENYSATKSAAHPNLGGTLPNQDEVEALREQVRMLELQNRKLMQEIHQARGCSDHPTTHRNDSASQWVDQVVELHHAGALQRNFSGATTATTPSFAPSTSDISDFEPYSAPSAPLPTPFTFRPMPAAHAQYSDTTCTGPSLAISTFDQLPCPDHGSSEIQSLDYTTAGEACSVASASSASTISHGKPSLQMPRHHTPSSPPSLASTAGPAAACTLRASIDSGASCSTECSSSRELARKRSKIKSVVGEIKDSLKFALQEMKQPPRFSKHGSHSVYEI